MSILSDEALGSITGATASPTVSNAGSSSGLLSDEALSGISSGSGNLQLSDKPRPDAEKPYEAKIKSFAPQAEEKVKKEGALGAFGHGFANVPFLGPMAQEGYRKYQAYKGEGGGETFDERLENLRAMDEATSRKRKEEHPYATLAGEVAQAVPLMFVPGVGWTAAAARTGAATGLNAVRAARTAEAVGALGKGATAAEIAEATAQAKNLGTLAELAPGAAEIAGVGVEGAGFAAAQTAGENAFGTAQPSDKKDIGEAAKEGLIGGAVLGTAAKGAGAAWSALAPEWLKGLGRSEEYIAKTYLEKLKKGEESGQTTRSLDDILAYNNDPANIDKPKLTFFDIRNPEADAYLTGVFKDHPFALQDFKNNMNARVFGSGERGHAFLKDIAGVNEFNAAEFKDKAKQLANDINESNFSTAYEKSNGAGTWKDDWNSFLNDKRTQQAIRKTTADMRDLHGDDYANVFARRGSSDLDAAGLPPDVEGRLYRAGIDTLDKVNGLSRDQVQKIFGLTSKSKNKNIDDIDLAEKTEGIYKQLKSSIKGINLDELYAENPNVINVEFLDRLQQQLKINADAMRSGKQGTLNEAFARKLDGFRNDIIDTLKNPKSDYYNPEYHTAFEGRDVSHRTDDAYTAGLNFLKNINDPLKLSRAKNETGMMTDSEKEFFKRGILEDINNKAIGGGGPSRGAAQQTTLNYKKVQDWMAKPDVKEALVNILGKDDFARMEVHLLGEAMMNDSLRRSANISEKGNLFWALMKNSFVPGAGYGLEYLVPVLKSTPVGISAVVARLGNYYMGHRFATKAADGFLSNDPAKYKEIYDAVNSNPKFRDAVSRTMNAVNYTLATQIAGDKFNAHRVSKVLQDLGPDERALANSIIKDAYAVGNKIRDNIPAGSAAVQRASGGRINREEGGRTPFPWQQFYAPKGDTIGPVAPKRLIQPGKDEEGNPTGGVWGYHGSPRRFSKFSDKFLLTGTGRSSFGPPSHYIAQNKNVAMQHMDRDTPGSGEGYLYRVNVAAHPDRFVDWNAAWGEQHPEIVANMHSAIKSLGVKKMAPSTLVREYQTGQDVYNRLKDMDIPPAEIKAALMEQGIRGMKYFDKPSLKRATTFNPRYGKKLSGTRNFAVFDPKDIKIIERHAHGGRVDEWHENHEIHREDGGRTPMQPIMPPPLASDDPARQTNFDAYRQGAKTVDENGQPTIVYRGERRVHPAGEMPTTKGRAVPSFATDKYVADVYAGQPYNFHGDVVNQSNVGKYHFAANNPIDLRHLGGHAYLEDVFKSLPLDLSKPTALKEGKLGYNDIAKILSTLDQTVENSNAESHTGYSHENFKALAKEIRADGKTPWGAEEILKTLGRGRVDLYALGDNPEFVNALRKMKHDALIHKDVFDGGYKRYKGEKNNLEIDKSGTVLIDAYRPLDPGVYKSAWGNKGTYNRKSKNPLESRGGAIPAESHGGFVRRNRATGGRVPEADKLFKQAKKYVDDRTKGMLDQPDERIVHALRIAKARNS